MRMGIKMGKTERETEMKERDVGERNEDGY